MDLLTFNQRWTIRSNCAGPATAKVDSDARRYCSSTPFLYSAR
jgi:hypothetical protein